MTLRGSLLRAVERARAIPQALGLRTIRVWIRSSVRTRPALLTGGTIANTDVELVPRPAVVRLDTVDPSYWGAEAVGLTQGLALSEVYQIGPITPAHATGGYAYADLVPLTSTPTDASRVLLADAEAGGTLGTTPIEFEVVSLKGQDKGRSLRWEMLVRRVREHGTNG